MGFVTTSFADHSKGRLQRPAVILTFDDGRKDAITTALPALSKRGMRATFFVITGSVGKPGFLTWSDIESLRAAGMEIGSHSVNHRHGPELSDDDLLQEFTQSRVDIESHLKEPVRVLAYPYNSFRRRMAHLAEKAGYDAAVAGPAHGTGDRFRLLRHGVYRESTLDQFRQTIEAYLKQ
jgi:peptidoglycan/xylan/chitin deacetylase (PgdA/CDA1 family)